MRQLSKAALQHFTSLPDALQRDLLYEDVLFVKWYLLTDTCEEEQQKEEKMQGMDSPEWNRTYDVFRISRLYLHSLRFSVQEITHLTDEDLQRIAADLRNGLE